MLSRVADCVFWMSRYIERAENVARFVDVNLNLTLDLGGKLANQWDPLIYTTGDHEHFYERYGAATQKNAVAMLTFDEENPNSIVSCLKYARENARTVREIIAAPVWEELNKFYLLVKDASRNGKAADNPFEFFNNVKRSGQLIVGIMEATMSRGEAWHFAQMGRLLERADKTSRILDVKYFILLPDVEDVGTPLDSIQWSALLKSASALEMYRKRHGRITPNEVAEFLILDAEFPRALRFCLRGTEESLRAVTGTAYTTFRNQAERRLGQVRSELDYAQIADIIEQGLHEFVDNFQKKLNLVGEAIHDTFFAERPLANAMTQRHGAAPMTFCLGMKVQSGLVGIADTRVTSGAECITARKLTVFQHAGHPLFVMTSGLRSVRDKVITYFEEALDESTNEFDRLHKALNTLAAQTRRVASEDKEALENSKLAFNFHALVGGQLKHDREPKLYLLYPQGNWVEVGAGTPYCIIGETGYGKPILDRTLKYSDSMQLALKVGALAFDSTRISSTTVDFPLDVVVFENGGQSMFECRYEKTELAVSCQWWQERLRASLNELPSQWLDKAFVRLGHGENETIPITG